MSGKMISLTGELHMNSTGFSVTVEALETLKIIGIAYGVYDHAEDLRDCRVTLENGERPALVVQEDVSLHGSPFWKPSAPSQRIQSKFSDIWLSGKLWKCFARRNGSVIPCGSIPTAAWENVQGPVRQKRWSAMSDNLLTVLVVEPAKPPYVKQIPDTLQAMQEIVGGNIDATYPFEDPVALVFNSEGKFSDLQPNRLLRLENGDPYDVVCGTFFLAGLGGETFVSLTQDQLQRYGALYNREMLFPFPKKKERTDEHER